ncbi:probable ATP-dependent RNA helicase DDX60 [Nilaparvata lugens]|uniref:probable ATP-dependent RNA helicase DDX60 n=1 Tax=Nilaparvata lugens TaxID=108931 RepID=UPI00193CF2F7|nr:probable ATP-dependent RNA helicase DDX60 [Nilaparvata lugens]XP_022201182.2 probable ATP-dependent RNA helicase DDX60 [Nilaparvata lugens]XP_039279146.1 probable ATP-dependent RNA helicase DDX60 [Nilaparvata lugens]
MDSEATDERSDEGSLSEITESSDDSSENSDDELDQEQRTSDLLKKDTTSEWYEDILLDEKEYMEQMTENLSKVADDISELIKSINSMQVEHLSKASYQDITPLLIGGTAFLLDASSLTVCAIQQPTYNRSHGGQSLHFIYICEKIIQLLCREGVVCAVVSFRDKSRIWQDAPQLSLAENILMCHLKNNTQIPTQEFDSVHDPKFHQYVTELQPNFMLLAFNLLDCLEVEFESQDIFHLSNALFSMHVLMSLSLGLFCVDINSLQLGCNSLMAFVRCSFSRIVSFREILQKYCIAILNKFPNPVDEAHSLDSKIDKFKTKDVRRSSMICVAESLINETQFEDREELIRAVLVYAAAIEVFPVESRCFNHQDQATDASKKLLSKIVRSIDAQLRIKRFEGFDYSSVADVWHGSLFIEILSSFLSMEECDNLGCTIDKVYKEYISEFSDVTGLELQPFPISLNRITENMHFEENIKTIDDNLLFSGMICDLPVVNNEIFNRFCKDLCSIVNEATDDNGNVSHETIITNLKWQNTVKLSSFIERAKTNDFEDNIKKKYKHLIGSDKDLIKFFVRRKVARFKGKLAYYMDQTASILEGKTLERRAIVCETPVKNPKKNQKQQKKDKISKSAAKLIEDNNLRKEKKLQEEENAMYVSFKKQYKINLNTGKSYQVNLVLINQVITKMKTDLYYCKIMMYKVEILFHLWEEECKRNNNREERDLSYAKELLLAARELISCAQRDCSLLGDREKAKIGKKLSQLGFKELAKQCSLPASDDYCADDVAVGESLVRFQMKHLGADLLRKSVIGRDTRADGYIPDQWQSDIFDAIDKRQSALVVAPSGAGKTNASFYCMEKVLREGNKGKIVYVAPTIRLAWQVSASVNYRFKGKSGIVMGFLTPYYQVNVLDCQILVTVPVSLEALFMLSDYHTWTKQLRYAIFDEFHCLTNSENGVSWERCLLMTPCPFLALSATIQNPQIIYAWLQKVERYKQELDPTSGSRVVMILHNERHNDLLKHVYDTDKGLRHIHPVSCLTNRVMEAHQGIPKHISLAPGEMIELYDMMVSVAGTNHPDLTDLQPEKYFAQFESGFISRDEAKNYESKIRQVIGEWLTNKRELLDDTVKRFRTAQIDCDSGGNKTLAQLISSIRGLVETLKNKSLLPAIVFAYDRGKCSELGSYITEVYKEEEEKNVPKMKKNRPIVADDDEEDRNIKCPKKGTKSVQSRAHRSNDKPLNPLGLTECDPQYSLRNVTISSSFKDIIFLEERLFRKGYKKDFHSIEMLRRGVGVLHSQTIFIYRRCVEMLFCKRFLNIVFTNAISAPDLRMPCRSVVILGDSPLLTTVHFQQICDRVGRRDVDATGDVIFFGLDVKKVPSIQTPKLPKMNGNHPLTVTTVLRLLHLYSSTKAEKNRDDGKEKRLVLNRILTVLNESLVYQMYPDLRTQMKYFFGFSCNFLKSLRLLNPHSGVVHLLTSVVNILHRYEQGVLAFVYLLASGYFNDLCRLDENQSPSDESCDTIMIILCRLFTIIPFPYHSPKAKDRHGRSIDIRLPCLPPDAVKALQNYNNIVKASFTKYYKNVSKFNAQTFGKDEKLPISGKVFKGRCSADDLEKDGASLESMIAQSCTTNAACSVFAGLSGQTDDDLFVERAIIGNARDEVFANHKCIPFLELDAALDGFAYNFYKYGFVRPTVMRDHLKPGPDYKCFNDFEEVLDNIKQSLEELQWVDEFGKDVLFGVRKTFAHIRETYLKKKNF